MRDWCWALGSAGERWVYQFSSDVSPRAGEGVWRGKGTACAVGELGTSRRLISLITSSCRILGAPNRIALKRGSAMRMIEAPCVVPCWMVVPPMFVVCVAGAALATLPLAVIWT